MTNLNRKLFLVACLANAAIRQASRSLANTPWIGDPRINIQDHRGKAKAYQVRQVLLAIKKLESMQNER